VRLASILLSILLSILFVAGVMAGCSREVAGGKADGAAVYAEVCARCHGRAGVPSADMAVQLKVPDLTRGELHARMSDADLRAQILGGSPRKGMPGFAGALTDDQVQALIEHLRTFKK
jgi:mono/diheme cytochrome c family protein